MSFSLRFKRNEVKTRDGREELSVLVHVLRALRLWDKSALAAAAGLDPAATLEQGRRGAGGVASRGPAGDEAAPLIGGKTRRSRGLPLRGSRPRKRLLIPAIGPARVARALAYRGIARR
jgi:hypothetical protein